MIKGQSSDSKRRSYQTLVSEKPPNKRVKPSEKAAVSYSDYLQCYLTHDFSGKSILEPSIKDFKSLQEFSVEAVVSNPEIIKQYPPENSPFQVLEAGTALLFAPKLSKRDWLEQLEILKKHNAEVCGIEFSRFNCIDVIDLSKIHPNEVEVLTKRTPNELIVVYGTCTRSKHLPISKGVTVIGRDAVVTVSDKSFRLHIPRAKIIANPQGMGFKPNEWLIVKNESVINTDSKQFDAGHYPLIYLNQSNLVGVELDCQNVTQGIVGSRGNIHVANNKINNTRECGVFVHDCESAIFSGNQLHTKEANDKIGIISAKCKECIHSNNSVTFS